MTDYSYILFNKTPLQLRLLGARGAKAFGRNQRLRRAKRMLLVWARYFRNQTTSRGCPPENASVLPWLGGTAFLHSVMMQEKKGMMKVWNMVLISATSRLCYSKLGSMVSG